MKSLIFAMVELGPNKHFLLSDQMTAYHDNDDLCVYLELELRSADFLKYTHIRK